MQLSDDERLDSATVSDPECLQSSADPLRKFPARPTIRVMLAKGMMDSFPNLTMRI